MRNAPSPFEIGRTVGNNFGNSFQKTKDEGAIESILSEAMSSGDPAVIQNSIGKILSQVSPERQGAAVQYLQNTYMNLQQQQQQRQQQQNQQQKQLQKQQEFQLQQQQFQQKQKEFQQQQELQQQQQKQKREDELAAGLAPGIAPQSQAQLAKDKAKEGRISQYGLGGDVASNGQSDPSTAPPNVPNPIPGTRAPSAPKESIFNRLSKDQLTTLTGHPDKEVSEPAKARLDVIKNEEKIGQGQRDAVFKSDLKRSENFIDETDAIASTIPQKESALELMDDAIVNRNLSYFSPDNLAEVTGIEGFRSPEGAIFKTAGKEYFLGNIARAGARPNQWIEQQIQDMMTKIGRSTEANLSVNRALRNELDLQKERVRLTEEVSDKLRSEGDLSQGKLGSMVNKQLSQYAEKKQLELFNDLRAIKSIADKAPQKFRKVEPGTEVSTVVAQALLRQFNNDPEKAAEEAKKLGYEF